MLRPASQLRRQSFFGSAGLLEVQVQYTDGVVKSHGGTKVNVTAPPPITLSFEAGEVITRIDGKAGHGWNSVTFITNKGTNRSFGNPHSGGVPYTFSGPVYGFTGSICVAQEGCPFEGGDGFINGLGVWTRDPGPPAPTRPPPPPK